MINKLVKRNKKMKLQSNKHPKTLRKVIKRNNKQNHQKRFQIKIRN